MARSSARMRAVRGSGMTGKVFGTNEPQAREPEQHRHAQATKAVLHAASKVDRRRFSKINRRAAHFANGIPKPENLREDLVVENKIVRVCFQRQTLDDFA